MATLKSLLETADSYREKMITALPPDKEAAVSSDRHFRDGQAAYDFMLAAARQDHMDITEETIKRLHSLLYEKPDADRYRTYAALISEINYTPAAPEDIPRLMDHLANQIRSSRTTLHPIELAAMAQQRLISIYPFSDGNGRTARLLMNLILVNAGYGMVSIPPERQEEYLNCLSAAIKQGDMDRLSKFIAECVIESEKEYCKRI
ncbi:Fic family protein [Anaerolentibacter hominis]|uniref:Fic family protein n=1 Tax=Anaerolentibacter hominis TaxID=3079009 RepID=UPI0031B7EB20